MSNVALYANNAISTLAGAITNTSLTANVASGGGALFPHPGAGQYFALTFTDEATGLLNEIVWVTNVTGDTLTMTRAQEGTTAQNWNAGDLAQQLVTAGDMGAFVQFPQLQSGSTNSAVDTGTLNNFVVALTPTLTAHLKGAPIFWQAANGNSGPSTFNDGVGSLPLVNPDGTALGTGTVTAGGYYISIYDGAGHFQLISTSNEALSSQGIATTGDMKFRPTTEAIAGWVVANGLTIGNATSGATGRANSDALNLFTWHWVNFSNTQCPVLPSGRGASPAADFAANKTIQVLAWQGMTPVGVDTMGGAATTTLAGVPFSSGSATVPGSVMGENLHALSGAENGVHTHSSTLTDPEHQHGGVVTSNLSYTSPGGATVVVQANNVGITSFAFTNITLNNASSGSGTAHNTVSRAMGVTWYIKL